MSDAPVPFTFEEAVAMLPDGDYVHTLVQHPGTGLLLGMDMVREDVLEMLRTGRPEASGDIPASAKHGMVAYRSDDWSAPVFIETRQQEVPS